MKLASLTPSGGAAKCLIQDGQVQVNGSTCLQRGKKLRPGDTIVFQGRQYQIAYAP